MKALQHFWWLYRREVLVALVLLLAMSTWLITKAYADTPEVVLVIGEPYEEMRKHSSAPLPPVIPGHVWGGYVEKPAILRFNDPQFGFITLPAKFLSVGHDERGLVDSVRMSPQVDTLNLDEALKVTLDLQEQLRRAGWKQHDPTGFPAYENNAQTRQKAKENKLYTTFWNAGNKYQLMIGLSRFADDKRPDEERYLITIAIAKPWIE